MTISEKILIFGWFLLSILELIKENYDFLAVYPELPSYMHVFKQVHQIPGVVLFLVKRGSQAVFARLKHLSMTYDLDSVHMKFLHFGGSLNQTVFTGDRTGYFLVFKVLRLKEASCCFPSRLQFSGLVIRRPCQ